jgi:hypothetical protein
MSRQLPLDGSCRDVAASLLERAGGGAAAGAELGRAFAENKLLRKAAPDPARPSQVASCALRGIQPLARP